VCGAQLGQHAADTAASTSTSLAPRLRVISKPTTGLPFSSAALRRSATVSVTVATWSSRTRRPSAAGSPAGQLAADCTVAMVRTACSARPRSVRPPAASCCTWRSWRDTSAAVAPSASRRAGSSATCTSRVTPPTRCHRAHAVHAEQGLGDVVVDKPAQRLVVHAGRGDGVGEDGRARQVHFADLRVAQVGGQVAAHAADGVAHVVHRLLRGFFKPELDGDGGVPSVHLAVDVLDALQRGHRVLDLARHLGFQLRRRGAGQLAVT
jgi:hypothetical protein